MTDSANLTSTPQDTTIEETESSPSCGSHLVVDFGTSYTVATLYDIVDGQYRFISRGSSLTTVGAPWYDVKFGLQVAVNRISESTGRKVLNSQGYLICPSRMDGSGVDCFGIVVSVSDPLKTAFICLMEDPSLQSARKAMKTIYSLEVDHFSISDARSEHDKLESLLTNDIDLALIVGGSDGSTDQRLLEEIHTLSIALSLLDDFRQPQVIYAANSDLSEEVSEELKEETTVVVTENVRPTVDYEEIDDLIGLAASLNLKKKIITVPGLDGIRDPSKLPILPTAHAFGGITEYLASLLEGKVVGLDIGSGSVSLVVSDPGKIDLIVRSDLGLGAPISNILQKQGLADIYSWTDGQTRSTEVRDFILNKSIMPHTLPTENKELVIEQAISGLLTKEIVADLKDSDHLAKNGKLAGIKLLVLRGGILSKSPSIGYPLLAVLDGLQPVGVFRVVLDTADVLPAMGLLAAHNPQLVVQVLDNDVLTDVGWVVVADGQGELGKPAVRLTLELSDGELVKRDIKYGALELIRLPHGQKADLALQPAPNINIGEGPGNASFHKITGGTLGLLIDARGELSSVKGDEVLKRKHQQRWLKVVSS